MSTKRINYLLVFVLCWSTTYVIILYTQLYSPDDPIFTFKAREIIPIGRKESGKNPVWFHNKYILKYGHYPHCVPLNPDILLYNRIFKTGSTSTQYWLDSFAQTMNFTLEFATTEDWYDTGKSHVYPGIIARHATKKLSRPHITHFVFVAHFYFRYQLNLTSTYTYINQVREPVKRVISHYFYIHRNKDRPSHRLEELKKSGNFDESFEKCLRLQHKGCERNVMTRFFCGKHSYCNNGDKKALRKAKKNIRRYYAAVGVLEHLDIYLEILQKIFPSFVPTHATTWVYKEKVNSLYNISEVSMATIQHIKRLNSADLKLYEFIKERFWSQAKACKMIV